MSSHKSYHPLVASKWILLMTLLLVILTGRIVSADSIITDDDPNPSESPVIGISIGNSWSSVAIKNLTSPKDDLGDLIPNRNGLRSIPSVVSFTESGRALVGEEAVEILLEHPERSVVGFKRLLGKNFSEVTDFVDAAQYKILGLENDEIAIEMSFDDGKTHYKATEIMGLFIKELKDMAEQYIGEQVKEAIISVPFSYGDRGREAIKDAARMAGLEVPRTPNECSYPSILPYGLEEDPQYYVEKFYIVYNADGASFDVNVVGVEDGVAQVLSGVRREPIGSGGYKNDWNHLRDLYQDKESSPKDQDAEYGALVGGADQKPLGMSASGNGKIRAKLDSEAVNSFDISQLLEMIEQALQDSNLTVYDIHGVVATGDTSRIPELRSLIATRFGSKVPIYDQIDPRVVTTHGLALQAWFQRTNVWNGACIFGDVNSLTLGVETAGGIMTKIVKRGTTLPTKKRQKVTTLVDNQTSVLVNIFSGERSFVAKNKLFGSLELRDMKPRPRGELEMEIEFELDANFFLKVTIKEQGTDNKNSTLFEREDYDDPDLLEEHLKEDWDLEEEKTLLEMVQKRIDEGEFEIEDAEITQIVVSHKETPDEWLPCGKICQWWQWLQHPWVGDMFLW